MNNTELDEPTLCKQLIDYLSKNGYETDYELCANFLISYNDHWHYEYSPEDKITQDVLL
jgi:hypothetical protein